MINSNYVNVIYEQESRPITKYPGQLVRYLIERYKIDQQSMVLDSGCGRGDFAYCFAEEGMNCVGIDGNEGMIFSHKLLQTMGGWIWREISFHFQIIHLM